MRALIAEFTVRPGCEEQARELMLALTEQVRSEPGNLAFEPTTREDEPRAYVVYEVYADEAAFQDHIASFHAQAFNSALTDLIEGTGSVLHWLTPLAVAGAA